MSLVSQTVSLSPLHSQLAAILTSSRQLLLQVSSSHIATLLVHFSGLLVNLIESVQKAWDDSEVAQHKLDFFLLNSNEEELLAGSNHSRELGRRLVDQNGCKSFSARPVSKLLTTLLCASLQAGSYTSMLLLGAS